MTDVTGGSRRLHGVLLADMTGFSRLMGEDESRAVEALMRIRDVFAAVVPLHGGTLDVFVGDCFVALFDSAVDAVQAAIQIQSELASHHHEGDPVRIRIGIHLGDVVRSGTEILGDSVNVAARIQAIAPPGGITVSEDVYRAVRNRVKVPVRDLGAKSLKNIRDKMRVYVLDATGAAAGQPAPAEKPHWRPLGLALAALALLLVTAGAVVAYRTDWWGAPAGSSAVRSQARPAHVDGEVVTVGVTGVSALGEVPPWMQDTTRDGLNTLLSKVDTLRVFSREKIDFMRQRRGLTEIEVAETLGIQKMISGSLALQNGEVLLDVRVVDIATGLLDASETVRGAPEALIELQNQLASSVIAALGVHLSAAEQTALFALRTRETLDGYRRLADTFGEAPEGHSAGRRERTSWLRWIGVGVAWADEADPDVAALLEAYRAALEHKDVEAVAAVHVSLNDEQRAGFDRYFESADGLKVSVDDIDVLLDGDEGVVTFTRRDVFRDRNSDKEVELEVRLSTIVVRKDGKWLMRGVRRS